MNKKTMISIMIGALMLMACGDDKSSSPGAPATSGGPTGNADTVVSFRYFKGNFFAPPNAPNWTDDMTIHFTTAGYHITAKHPDADCRKTGPFTAAQTTELFDLVSSLTVMQATATTPPRAPDAGVEIIELTLESGEKRKYHLSNLDVPAGELYATNPNEVSTYLKTLENSLATLCEADAI